jgi:Transposase DNA-binding
VPRIKTALADRLPELGDERLNRRLGLLADAVAEAPGAGFPTTLDDAELGAAYRLFGIPE